MALTPTGPLTEAPPVRSGPWLGCGRPAPALPGARPTLLRATHTLWAAGSPHRPLRPLPAAQRLPPPRLACCRPAGARLGGLRRPPRPASSRLGHRALFLAILTAIFPPTRKSSHEMWIKLKEMFGGSTSQLVGGDSEELSSPSHHEELQVASTSGRDDTCIYTNHVEEIKELEAQVLSLKKDLEKRHEGRSALEKMLSVKQSPNDKSGLGFNSNNKNKSKSKSNKKKGQEKVKDPAKLVCFKCKVEGHHVRSCPLKKKKHLSEKQQGKRPQGQGQAHA
ncbi:hypothetical protein QYE76_056564 [Lolium multiflorum]|uniref:CCHC-type domain-containing protein n=1 Tax=Lolium multiflorum TaxID=4521 RepID=A0AAD8T2R6_LOLMU|nr:hypothetical protein QYE76_056564 [Lolium multiflorum]